MSIFCAIVIAVILYDAKKEIEANRLLGTAGPITYMEWFKENTLMSIAVFVLSIVALNNFFFV